MVRKGQVQAGQLSHYTGEGLPVDAGGGGGAEEEQEEGELEEGERGEGVLGRMEHRDGGGTRQLSHDSQSAYLADETFLRRSYGGFGVGVSVHPQGFPLSYRGNDEVVPQREEVPQRNVMHRPYENRDLVNVHQGVDAMRWRDDEQGYEESNKQLAVAQMMAEMHQGSMLQQRNSNLMMMASQMGQGRYHPEFLQTAGGRMLFGAPAPRVSTEERYPSYQAAEMMRQNPAMMFGMGAPPSSIEKGRFEELFQQQRGMMMDMAARSMGDSRMQDYYLGRGGVVEPVPTAREMPHARNHMDFTHPRVGVMMGMGHDGWRGSAETVDSVNTEDIRQDVHLEGVEDEELKAESHGLEHSNESFIERRPTLPRVEERSPDSTPSMSIIQPNHALANEGIVPTERLVGSVSETVSSSLPLRGVGSLGGVRDTVAEMVMEMERRDREKLQEMSASDNSSSSSDQSESESEADERGGHDKPKHHSIPARVSPREVNETSKVLLPVSDHQGKPPADSCSQDSGSDSEDSSVAPNNDFDKAPSSVSSREDEDTPVHSPFQQQPPAFSEGQSRGSLPELLRELSGEVTKREEVPAVPKQKEDTDSSSEDNQSEKEDEEEEESFPQHKQEPKESAAHQRLTAMKSSSRRPSSPDSDASSTHTPDIKSVRMPMWRWIGPKQSRSLRVTRQSVKKGNLTIRLVKRRPPPKKRVRRRKVVAVPVTAESVPTAVPCAHPTSKRRGKVFQKVVMEDMVMMDGQIMTVNKRGRPKKARSEDEPPRKVGRPRKHSKVVQSGPPKKRGRPKKGDQDKTPVKRKPREPRTRKNPVPRKTIKLISIQLPEGGMKESGVRTGEKKEGAPSGKDFGCPFCGKEFKCGFRLNKHMQSHIPKEMLEARGDGPIQMQLALSPDREKRMVRFDQCPHCKQLFMDLKAHVRRVHTEAEEHLCSICGHVLRNKESLVAHEKRHKVVAAGKKEFVCKVCGAEFFFQTGLNQHSKRHLVERACVCDICGKAFKTTKDLEKHKLVHSKPHSCPVCKRRFGQKSNMKAHMRQHSGDKPFRCDLCSASFTHNVSLKTHKKNTHGIDWWKEHGRAEESDEKMEKMTLMSACLDYFGNTGGNPSQPPPPPTTSTTTTTTPTPTKWENADPPLLPPPHPTTNPTHPHHHHHHHHLPTHNTSNPTHNSTNPTHHNPNPTHHTPNPNLNTANPNPINPLHPLNPVNPLNSINQFAPINHIPVSHHQNSHHHHLPHHAPLHLHPFTPLNSLNAMHPDPRPHPLEDIKPII